MSLQIGDTIPLFTLKDQNGVDFDISSLIGKKPFVIYFYPKDYTPKCTEEACSFRDKYQDFIDVGAEVIGISADSVKIHQKFAKGYRLPFMLLSDSRREVSKLFGIKNKLFGLLPGRETYVFNEQGKMITVFNSASATQHSKKALEALKKQ